MKCETRDAAEIQALIRHHASTIVEAIDGGGIKPSQRDELERTCLRMLDLSKALAECTLADQKTARERIIAERARSAFVKQAASADWLA